ncbi:emerin (Emery-Dreifuss muscular dystrophy) [Scleropages formosus]|uniref:Emerin n=1 Tax=Scleropages formosus TaxID=113540 RepID=A0A8C9TIT5_SCLFO|nr:emerin [Scleropages formosus]
MSSLSTKSDKEINELLDEYGIKHGPVVGSTRQLYEKKLKEVMAKDAKGKPSSDKTYYREEQEEVTYVHYRTPPKNENFGDGSFQRRYTSPGYTGESPMDYEFQPSFHRTEPVYSHVSRSKPPPLKLSRDGPSKESAPAHTRFIPLWFQFLVFLGVAAFLYFVFTNMETPESNPFVSKLE